MAEPAPRRPYVFGPMVRSGVTYGVSWSQASLVALGLLASVLLLRAGHGRTRMVVALLILLGSLVMVTLPIAGRTPQQWVPVVASFAVAKGRRQHRGAALSREGLVRRVAVPPFSALELLEVEDGHRSLGVLLDRENATATAMIDVGGTAFALADPLTRQRLVDAWAAILAASAGQSGPLMRLSWIERVVPDQSRALWVDADSEFRRPAGAAVTAARASYLALLAGESPRGLRHESHVAVSVRADRGRAWEPVLREVATAMAGRCRDAGLGEGLLASSCGLRSYLRHQFAAGPVVDGYGPCFPLGVRESWGAVRTDGAWQAVYWVAEWPRTEVGCDFLLPLLGVPVRRTVALVMEPLPPARAIRSAERRRTSNTADTNLRRRHGFAVTARAVREHDAAARRETELAAGHGAFRFSGFVAVSAVDEEQLRRDCDRLEQAAAAAHLDLRRLYGSQRLALANVLPTGRGL